MTYMSLGVNACVELDAIIFKLSYMLINLFIRLVSFNHMGT